MEEEAGEWDPVAAAAGGTGVGASSGEDELNSFARSNGSSPGRGTGWEAQPSLLQAGAGVGASTSNFF